jgi:cytidylate kinase
LLAWQRQFQQQPGLIADGRDMGTMVFPCAKVKIFLTAQPEERAKRRYKQLKEKGIDANMPAILQELNLRDARDQNRQVAPLLPAEDALVIDTSNLSVSDVVSVILAHKKNKRI